MDDNPSTPDPRPNQLPKLRPYQVPAAEQKARDEKEAAERRERIEELRKESVAPKKKRGFLRSFLRFMAWMLLIVVLTAGAGFAGWYFLLREKTPATGAKSTDSNTSQQATSSSATDTATKHYESPNFHLELDYPQDWIVTDSTTKLSIVSPATQLKAATGTKQNGQMTLTIQNKQVSTPAFKAGNALAVHASEKIAYAKPSPTQRANSYLSFLGYADSTAKGLDGVYVTGDNGYQVGQAIPQVDIAKADPLITVTFTACSDSKCAAAGKPMTLAAEVWDDATFAKPIKAMLQSLIVQ
jgi:hypothetical protein